MSISAKEGKGEDAFSRWTQTLISTYIDLFIRLAVIYFGLFFVQLALNSKLGITNYNTSNVMVNVFATLFIIIGLMLFIKQAPKYIKGALGIKDGGAGVGMTVLGTVAGHLQAGGTVFSGKNIRERISDFRNFASTVNEEVAEKSFGDKSKGHGQAYNFRKDSIKKLQEDYDRDLRQEYYRRGLDFSGEDNSNYTKHLFENTKAEKAKRAAGTLENNKNRYSSSVSTIPTIAGRGVAVRFNDNTQQQVPTSPPPTQQTRQQTSVQQNSQQQQNNQQGNPPTGPTP